MVSLGCPKNLVDSEVMLGLAQQAGHQLTRDAADADVLIVNTCAFIDKAKQESVDAILEMAEHKKSGRCTTLVVTGCMAERYREELKAQIPEIDAILGTAGPAVPGESAYSAAPSHGVAAPERSAASLRAVADDLTARFDAALADRDVDRCVEAILALDRARLDWAADTNVSDDAEHAASALRAMVVRLGELATVGARDPRETVGPFVEALLTMRARARAAKDFAASDEIRDCLVEAGIEVRDTAAGVEWTLR